jgi:hypothetical protein
MMADACRLWSPMSAIITDAGCVTPMSAIIITDVGARLCGRRCRLLLPMSAVVADVGYCRLLSR